MHVRSYDFYGTTLSTEKQRRHMVNVVPFLCRPNVSPSVHENFSSVRVYLLTDFLKKGNSLVLGMPHCASSTDKCLHFLTFIALVNVSSF